MKKFILFLMMVCMTAAIFAGNVVPVSDAQLIAKNFIQANFPTQSHSLSEFTLIHTEMDDANEPVYYVFSIGDKGFIIIAATDAVEPILAYSFDNSFRTDVPNYMLSHYKEVIVNNRAIKDASAEKEWQFYRNYEPQRDGTTFIGRQCPILLTSEWDQVRYYDNYVPIWSGEQRFDCDYHVPAGCVSASMAVLMHYYRYPDYGTGHVTYQPTYKAEGESDYAFPMQDQDFNVLHDYDMMPDLVKAYNGEVARLMWHCGISIHVSYAPDASNAYINDEVNAFKQNWGYNPGAVLISNSTFSEQSWTERLQRELDERHPIIFAGRKDGMSGGHAFFLDGYQEIHLIEDHTDSVSGTVWQDTTFSHVMMHVNYVWGGYDNAFYSFAGGRLANWSASQQVIVNLYPNERTDKATSGHRSLHSTTGTISDGPGDMLYQPNTDRTWMIYAPDAINYRFKLSRLELADSGDYVAFYPNGDLNNEYARYTGNNAVNYFIIQADSVLVRFVTNGDDRVSYGFVCQYQVPTTPTNCQEDKILHGEGTISFGGDNEYDGISNYRPNTTCTWKVNGCERAYFYYPNIELAPGDFIDIYDLSYTGHPQLIKRIDEYNWPNDDVFAPEGHKFRIKFVSDNYLESHGFELGYTLLTDIQDGNIGENVQVYPNPAHDFVNVNIANENGDNQNLRLCDVTGKTVWSANANGAAEQYTISTTDLAKGIYLLHVEGAQSKSVTKIIKQ